MNRIDEVTAFTFRFFERERQLRQLDYGTKQAQEAAREVQSDENDRSSHHEIED